MFKSKLNFFLRFFIVLLVTFSMVLTLSINIVAGFQVRQKALFNNTLELNQAYAKKLASLADVFLRSAQNSLAVEANTISDHMDNSISIEKEIMQLFQSNRTFNLIVVTDSSGKVLRSVPGLGIEGKTLSSLEEKIAIEEKRPFISLSKPVPKEQFEDILASHTVHATLKSSYWSEGYK